MGCSAHPRANIRPRQLRNREVPWEGSYRSKLMSRRTERPYKVDGAGELAPHSAARCSAPEINGPVVQQEFTFLLRETCSPSPPATAGAAASNGPRAGTGVSRGRSTEGNEPGNTGGPHNSGRAELVSGGSTATALPVTTKPSGRVIAQRLLQLEHGASSEDLLEQILSPENLQQGMAPGEGQWRGRWRGWDDHRPVSRLCPATLGEDSFAPLSRHVSPGAGAPGVHSQTQRGLAPPGHSDGPGPCHTAGDRAVINAGVRSALQHAQLWVPLR